VVWTCYAGQWAVADADPSQVDVDTGGGGPGELPPVSWVADKVTVPAPGGVNRQSAAAPLGQVPVRRGRGVPATASQVVGSVWRSILFVTCAHCILGGLAFAPSLCMTVPLLRSAKRHCKDAGVTQAAFWAGVLVLITRGWLCGVVAPSLDPSVLWWEAAAVTWTGLPEAAPWVLGGELSAQLGALCDCRPLLPFLEAIPETELPCVPPWP
jgi:hypothetical protein